MTSRRARWWRSPRMGRWLTLATTATLTTLAAPPGRAQVPAGRGFLMGVPNGSLTLRGGWAMASARSDIFDFTTNLLTLKRGDFSSPALDADIAFRLRPQTDIVLSTGFAGVNRSSEFRGFLDNNNQPIEQRTAFDRVPVTVSLKHYLVAPGRAIGRLAWVPSRFAPYLGAGGGAMWYRFRQNGDFIDFNDNSVFNQLLESNGWGPTAQVFAGNEVSLGPRFALVTEARYIWSNAPFGGDFKGFNRIDLSGMNATAGVAVRF